MPWEKSFNEETALENAMYVFWKKGYEPASIADLLTGTGLNRGSLYNAFGGKQQLFVKALLKYDRDTRRSILADLEALNNPTKAVGSLFDTIVSETVADQDRKGCFLINTALELSSHDTQVHEIVTQGMGELEAFFRRSIEVAQARNEMPNSLKPADSAKVLLALLVAIRVLGRGVFTEASLETISNEAKRLIGVSH